MRPSLLQNLFRLSLRLRLICYVCGPRLSRFCLLGHVSSTCGFFLDFNETKTFSNLRNLSFSNKDLFDNSVERARNLYACLVRLYLA